jgi:dienelactone hydrolase
LIVGSGASGCQIAEELNHAGRKVGGSIMLFEEIVPAETKSWFHLHHDSGKRPLVVLSHGTGGGAAGMAWLAETLASNGYIVAAVNHHATLRHPEASFSMAHVQRLLDHDDRVKEAVSHSHESFRDARIRAAFAMLRCSGRL